MRRKWCWKLEEKGNIEIGVVTNGKEKKRHRDFRVVLGALLTSCFSLLIYPLLPPGPVVNYLCRLTSPSKTSSLVCLVYDQSVFGQSLSFQVVGENGNINSVH